MATGDLEGNLERLRVQLRSIGFPHPIDIVGLKEGNPTAILPLLHYALLGYSRHVSRYLSENGYALFAKNDLRFIECVLKYLREENGYRCPLTVAQIFSRGFAERKFLFVHDVIQACKKKHTELAKLTRQQAQARKALKRERTLSDLSKHMDPTNIDALNMDDETLTMALDKVSRTQDILNGRLPPSKSDPPKSMSTTTSEEDHHHHHHHHPIDDMDDGHDEMDHHHHHPHTSASCAFAQPNSQPPPPHAPHHKRALTEDAKTDEIVRHHCCPFQTKETSQATAPELQENVNTRVEIQRHDHSAAADDIDSSLSRCYEQIRAQIIAVAEKLERQLLNLKDDVDKMTGIMQVKLTYLQRQTKILEQALPCQHFVGRTHSSYESDLHDKSFPSQRIDDGSLHIPYTNSWDTNIAPHGHMSFNNLEMPQTLCTNAFRGLHPHQQLSTQELIASVRARCNQTKELLMGGGWTGHA